MRPMILLLLTAAFPGAASAAAFQDGILLMRAQRYQEAIVLFEREARQNPGSPEVLTNLGIAYWRVKRIDDAWRCLDLLVKLDPKNPDSLRMLADVEVERRNYDHALELSHTALSLAPSDKDVQLVLSKALSRVDRQEEAMAILEKLIKRFPDDTAVFFRMADQLMLMGRPREAMSYLDRLVRLNPDNVDVRRARAAALYQLGYFDDAIAEWKRLAEKNGADEKTLLNLGWAAWHAKKVDEARAYGIRLVQLDDMNPVYLKFLASVELEDRNPAQALMLLERALKIKPDDPDLLLVKAKTLFHLQRDQEAMALLESLIRRNPKKALLQFQMADFLVQLDKLDEALVLFERLVSEEPDNLVYRKRRAAALYDRGDFDRAIAEWKWMAERYAADPQPLERLSEDAFNRRAWGESLHWLRRLAGVKALNATQWYKIARIFRETGQFPESLQACDKSFEVDPTFIAALYMKGEILEQTKDWPGTRAVYSDILSRNPNSIRALMGLVRVNEAVGDYEGAIRAIRAVQKNYFSDKGTPYMIVYEARLLADWGKVEQAMKVLKKALRRRASVPILLYHGVARFDRSDSIPKDRFREQMQALAREGYSAITVAELDRFLKGEGKLPPKPILVTFDDGRADAFKNADPVLQDAGLKATNFIILASLTRTPFHASLPDLKYWQKTGRWDLQLHANKAHVYVPVDAAGHKGHYLANRMWLERENRMETVSEFRARLETDYKEGKRLLGEHFHKTGPVAFAYPFGDYGQADYSNAPEAAPVNELIIQENFAMGFTQDPYGFNTRDSKRSSLMRFEVDKNMTGEELIRHLSLDEPWVKAKMLEASLWIRTGQPRRALDILDELQRRKVYSPEIVAQRGLAFERAGNDYEGRKLFERAVSGVPSNANYRNLLDQSRENSRPGLDTRAEGFSDSATRRYAKAQAGADAEIKAARLRLWGGQGLYSESGVSLIRGREGGVDLGVFATPKLLLRGSGFQRQLSGGTTGVRGHYAAGLTYLAFKGLRVDLTQSTNDVEAAAALKAVRQYTLREADLDYELAMNWNASANYYDTRFNDANREKDARVQILRTLSRVLSAGASYWHGDSLKFQPEYWTPRGLNQYMGLLVYRQPIGDISEITGRPRADLNLQFGGGYGTESQRTRVVESFKASFSWRITDQLSFDAGGDYLMTPFYTSRQASAGIGLTF